MRCNAPGLLHPTGCTFQIQRQQSSQNFLIAHFQRVVGPAVGGSDIQFLVRVVQPGRALVVEIGVINARCRYDAASTARS